MNYLATSSPYLLITINHPTIQKPSFKHNTVLILILFKFELIFDLVKTYKVGAFYQRLFVHHWLVIWFINPKWDPSNMEFIWIEIRLFLIK